jgi:putative two-component system response regulator
VRLKRFTDELDNAETVLCMLARSIEGKDPYTEGHCDRLSRYAGALAEKMGQKQEQCVALRRGGMVHDIGKVAVPEHVLLKPGALDPDERKLMEMHTTLGAHLRPLKSFRQVLPIIPRAQKLNGTGSRLKGDQIPPAHPPDRGHLRRADHRPPLPQGAVDEGLSRSCRRRLAGGGT